MSVISTNNAPAAIGPYSQAVSVKNVLTVVTFSGQIAIDPATGEMDMATFKDEARRVLKNLKAVVEAAGLVMDQLIKVRVYLTSMDFYDEFNGIYGEFFTGPDYPARVVIQVAGLPKNARVEVEAETAIQARQGGAASRT
ncbi:Rid family detoxifying hydrolase [Patescibacteria group bacterium]|nr:Rid family detoxifying hydrolase [Patescibacteria group bacterium]MBU0964362.1 Rid family detoxifying hydrolase [Patescibacteria group bacterium]